MRKRDIIKFFIIIVACVLLGGCDSMTRSTVRNDLRGVKRHLSGGEDVNRHDKYGWTPLSWAVYYNYPDMVKYLLEQKADPNVKTSYGYGAIYSGSTPLIIAAYYGYEEIVDLLLKSGANVDEVNCQGDNAYELAKKNGFIAVMYLLSKDRGNRLTDILEELKEKDPVKTESGNIGRNNTVCREKYRAVKDPTGWLALGLGATSGMVFLIAGAGGYYYGGDKTYYDRIFFLDRWDKLSENEKKVVLLYFWRSRRAYLRSDDRRRKTGYYVGAGIGGAAVVMLAAFIGRNIDAAIKEKKSEKSGDVSLVFPADRFNPAVLPNKDQLHFGLGLSMKF
ncbi:MAG: ankyrin repeat domain-containing protein [Spirochaetes bacterium]|nr:ankyrin repeat domain-containing protein [Spirochaetota bacterium]